MADPETTSTVDTQTVTTSSTNGYTNGTQDWRAGLSDDLRGDKALADFKDVAGLARSYVETKRMVGDAVRIPKADAKPEELTAFHRKLGVPASPGEYEVKLPEMPKDFPAWSDSRVGGFKQIAHQVGLTPAQVQSLIGWYAKDAMEQHGATSTAATERAKQEEAACVAELEKVWGPQGGLPWKRELGRAWNVTKMLFGTDTEEGRMFEMHGNNPKLLLKLAALAPELGEDRFIDGDGGTAADTAALSEQIEHVRNELKTATQGSVRYRDLKAQMDNLYQQKYGKR